jgi:undecaprenyl-diphosphatase
MSPVRRIARPVLEFASRVRRREATALGAVLLIVLGVWAFIELADEVLEGESRTFDEWVVKLFRQRDDPSQTVGPSWLAEAARDFTSLGSPIVLLFVTGAVAATLAFLRKYHAMWLVLVAAISGQIVSHLLKLGFQRDRPDVVPHLTEVSTSSFPSGHAMAAAVVYLTLAAILMRLAPRWRLKLYILAVGLLLTFLIGITRIFLGVHYPTDVLSGWTAGLVWALLCWLVALYLQRHGAVESEDETSETVSANGK